MEGNGDTRVKGRCARCGAATTYRSHLGYSCGRCVAEAIYGAIDRGDGWTGLLLRYQSAKSNRWQLKDLNG